MMNIRLAVLLVSFLLLCAGPAGAADQGGFRPLDQKFQVYIGGFFPRVSTDITINGENVSPPQIDFENVFGLEDSKTVLWGGARWRISRRNNLEFEFFKLNRNGSKTAVAENIEVGDTILSAGGDVESVFDISLGRLTYGFALVRNDRMEVQLKGGLHIMDLSTSVTLSGQVCEVTDPNNPTCTPVLSSNVESESVTAPLPHLGGSFIYGITPSVAARLQIIGFALEVDNIDGSLVEIDADFIWQPWDHWGFGAGLRYFDASVESRGSELNGKFEFDYFGPTIYVLGSF